MKCTLNDPEYIGKQNKTKQNKTLKNVENDKWTLQYLKYGKKY